MSDKINQLTFKAHQLAAPVIYFSERSTIESHWSMYGNSVHPSVWHPDIYPDYYESFRDWKSAMQQHGKSKQ